MIVGGYRNNQATILERRHELFSLAQGWADHGEVINQIITNGLSYKKALRKALYLFAIWIKDKVAGSGVDLCDPVEAVYYQQTENLLYQRDYLILKLQGPMQAWGRESFEGLRPSELFPGRGAMLGLLGACLGIDRIDRKRQQDLAAGVLFAVRVDPVFDQGNGKPIATQKMTDYHTVKNARKDYRGLDSHDTIQTWREYWQDACYTVAIWTTDGALITLDDIEKAINRPLFTPVLGRRSCPLARPLFDARVSAESALMALAHSGDKQGTVYSEEECAGARILKKRDVPIIHQPRQFASRTLYMTSIQGVGYVPE